MLRLQNIILLCLCLSVPAPGLSQSPAEIPSFVGTWEGTLTRGRDDMNLAITFDLKLGEYTAAITSSALGVFGMPADLVALDGISVKISVVRLDLEFYGTLRLNAEGTKVIRIDGDYYQQSEMVPVVLLPVSSPIH